MDLFEAITRRHSYRGAFKPDPVPQADLMRIAQAGVSRAVGLQPANHAYLHRERSGQAPRHRALLPRPVVQTAQAVFVIVTDNRPAYNDVSFEPQDYGAAVENMLLAITALGLRHRVAGRRAAPRTALPKRLPISSALRTGNT